MNKLKNISRWFINELHPDPLKLQKLLYFAQGFSFCILDKELFEEDLKAWMHGPVVESIYHEYKNFKFSNINTVYVKPEIDEETLEVLEYVKKNYGKFDGKYLEKLTHNQTPWICVRDLLDPDERTDKIIPKEIISEFFLSLLHQPKDEEWEKN